MFAEFQTLGPSLTISTSVGGPLLPSHSRHTLRCPVAPVRFFDLARSHLGVGEEIESAEPLKLSLPCARHSLPDFLRIET
jgi:hypothetical protein